MINQQAQIKFNIPVDLKDFVESKAQKCGMPLEGYIKQLIVKDVEDMDYPVFEASDRTIRAYKNAMKNRDKSIVVTDIDEFFKNL